MVNKSNLTKKFKIKLTKKLKGGSGSNIRPGYSGKIVEILNNNNISGRKVIIKKMHKEEQIILEELQGDGIVKILKYNKENYPIMEKLRHVDFYDNKNRPKINDITITFMDVEDNELVKQVKTEINYKYFLQLLNTIERINKKGYIWGDLKTNNLGISDIDGKLYIFDFGETKEINDENRYMDLLAFGKFYYNTITNQAFFEPGRYYMPQRSYIQLDKYKLLADSLITDDKELKKELMKIFNISNKNINEENLMKIYRSFKQYLQSKI